MSKESKRLGTTAARVLRAGRKNTGELRARLLEISASYKEDACKEELRSGEQPRSKKRKAKSS
jgi:hypothetical protein